MTLPQPFYVDDYVTLYNGDAREILPELSADLVVTDPPYGVGCRYDVHDDTGGPAYESWMTETRETIRAAAPVAFVTPGIGNLALWLEGSSWVFAWHKPGSTRRSGIGGFNTWEPVVMFGRRRIYQDALILPDAANHADVVDHPCPKPARLMSWLVSHGSDVGATVLDPFAGSGTTLVAAKRLGRRAVGVELSPHYCRQIVRRLGQSVIDLDGLLP